ncbi:Predicted arabinose efflux permease, MFS family [Rathayibacter oskolensis]|uniref:Predicted arabinose efflux permease, MFS family n=1 Tax=Rathayibacter oskolensis TaxID=1891671 RepID=A0A1X7PAL8_9MICO|nr:MFS transporter [Rathayibacter oskolensis]SMH47294.1 Predicted arabinose efflux permease, MFS family [Rathayibacter oskolensis]
MATLLPRFGRRGSFWVSTLVLALCLWSSGSPSVLYPSYAREWDLSSVVITTVFSAYPAALLLALLVVGDLSDAIGRRRTMLLGIALISVSAVAFSFADGVALLYVGRALQGVGTALALGAASASLVDNNVSGNPRVPSSLTTVSTATGLTLSLLLSGALAQYAPLPLQLSFWVLAVVGAATLALLAVSRDDRPAGARRWRPSLPHVPAGLGWVYACATLAVSVAYAVGALVLSLGAEMARELTGTTDLLVTGSVLALSSVVIGATALAIQRLHAHLAIVLGAVISVAALGLMEWTAAAGSLPLFIAFAVVGGVGYSLSFSGGLSLVGRTAPAEHRGSMISAVYLLSYLGQAVTAVAAGVAATGLGLEPAIDIVAPAVAALCLASGIVALVDLRRRRAASLVSA